MSEETIRINYSSNTPWEPLRGYSRAVRVGHHLLISGTTAVDASGQVIGAGDHYKQTKAVLDKIKQIVSNAGFSYTDIVRTRMFVTDISRWNEFARAHREAFDKIRPASAIVEVAKLTDPRLLVEIEAEAILGCEPAETAKIEFKDFIDL